ncbi:MAG: LamG domain-containing protein [Sedimentisphaerales bacterium]|nr:LamG domain-containing protein [Sedimentisphaerales bacterium]
MSLIKPVRAIQCNKSHPLSRGLAVCWLFNEGCGSQASDTSGSGFNIPVIGGTPEWVSGNHGSAMYFNSSNNEYMELDAAPVTNIPCTIMAWICPDIVTKGNLYYPLCIANKNVTNQLWGFILNNGANGEVALITNISLYGRAVSTKVLTAGQWHQIVGVAAGITDRRCYVDGGNKGTNTSSQNAPTGLNRISIARAGDSTPGYYFPGKVSSVFIWNRVLTDVEIAWMYREPYAIFDTDGITKSLSFPAATNSLAGSIYSQSIINGKLSLNNKTGQLEKSWLLDVLSNGMTGNAFKLSTALSMAWFWVRNTGCSALYRGTNIEQIDFTHILKTAALEVENISPPAYHESDKIYYYILRRFNKCGVPEQSAQAAVKVSLDSNGDIEVNSPNSVFTFTVKIVETNKVQLNWFYSPLTQKSQPACFKVYFDNGSGLIDYENSIAEVKFAGRKLYCFKSDSLETGTYLFAIRVVNLNGDENKSYKQIKVQMKNIVPSSIEIIDVQNV